MNLSITADNAEELKAEVLNLAHIFGQETHVPAQTTLPIEDKPTPKKRAAPKAKAETVKEAREEVTQVEMAAPAETSTDNSSSVTPAEITLQALQRVNETKGLPLAREVLSRFSAVRLSQVKESDYPEFIKVCAKECGVEEAIFAQDCKKAVQEARK